MARVTIVASQAGRISHACLCGHFRCILLLAQACPRMIQHLSSSPNVSGFLCESNLLHTTTEKLLDNLEDKVKSRKLKIELTVSVDTIC